LGIIFVLTGDTCIIKLFCVLSGDDYIWGTGKVGKRCTGMYRLVQKLNYC
jgi:hypothetical protein